MPRTKTVGLTPAGHRLVSAASELFYEHGIRAVGVELIAESAGTTKKTLYDRFGSKDALVALYLQRRAERWQEFLGRYLDEHAAPGGIDRVLGVFDALAQWNSDLTRGCAFVNAFAEIGGTDHPGNEVISAEKDWMRACYRRLLDEAGFDEAVAAELGMHLALLHEGALIMMTAGGQSDALAHARTAAERMLRGDFGRRS